MASPCILFFDELDAITTSRSSSGSNGLESRVLSTLLNEMDGIEGQGDNDLFVMAASNRADLLDKALIRPGRIDSIINMELPDFEDRLDILRVVSDGMPLSGDVDFKEVATMTKDMTGADLTAIVKEAAMEALRQDIDSEFISHSNFISAIKIRKAAAIDF